MRLNRTDTLLLSFFAVFAGAVVMSSVSLMKVSAQNAAIASFAAGRDTAVARDLAPSVRAARGLFLLAHGRVDDAQAELDAIGEIEAKPRAVLLYALANAHLRKALDVFGSAPMRRVAPLIGLAKSEYRQALRIDPQNWDARYNYDIASALSHDAEAAMFQQGDDMARERALVPDAAGAPNGLP